MAKATNSPRGIFQKEAAEISALTGATVTATGAVQGATINVSGKGSLSANSSGILWSNVTTKLPGNVTVGGGCIIMLLNGTGHGLAINTTGTTWRYINTSSRPFG